MSIPAKQHGDAKRQVAGEHSMAEIKANSMNLVPAGEVLFEDGAPLIYIFMVVKGKVEFT